MRGRFTPTVFGFMMVGLLVLTAAPTAVPASAFDLAGADTVNHAGLAGMSSSHAASAHKPCTSPDCAPEPDCPANMSMSDCEVNGTSCAHSGTTVMAHRISELGVQCGVAVVYQDQPNLILTKRSTSIFHPPRPAS